MADLLGAWPEYVNPNAAWYHHLISLCPGAEILNAIERCFWVHKVTYSWESELWVSEWKLKRVGDPNSYIPVAYKVQIKKATPQLIVVYSMSINTGMQFKHYLLLFIYLVCGVCTLTARLSTMLLQSNLFSSHLRALQGSPEGVN